VLKILEVSFLLFSILVFKADAFSGNEINVDWFSCIALADILLQIHLTKPTPKCLGMRGYTELSQLKGDLDFTSACIQCLICSSLAWISI
jgi:hypothetical protein